MATPASTYSDSSYCWPVSHTSHLARRLRDARLMDLMGVSVGTFRWNQCCSRAQCWVNSIEVGTARLPGVVLLLAALISTRGVSSAHAQSSLSGAPGSAPTSSQREGRIADTASNGSERTEFAFTSNPLNLLIGRYGISFEYQPVIHHTLIFSPHYDTLSGDPGQEGSCNGRCTDTLSGAGAEVGYRFYTGNRGFNGFFIGPSVIVSRHMSRFSNPDSAPQWRESSVVFNEMGGAVDVGGQWQLGHFVIGAGVGVQLTALSEQFPSTGRGIDVLTELNAGGGLLPRLLLNVGYTF